MRPKRRARVAELQAVRTARALAGDQPSPPPFRKHSGYGFKLEIIETGELRDEFACR